MEKINVGAIHELPEPMHDLNVGAIHELPTSRRNRRPMLLSKLVGYFKMNSAKAINIIRGTPAAKVWQRNYYEHIIRDDADFDRITWYIRDNPINWDQDEENVGTVGNS